MLALVGVAEQMKIPYVGVWRYVLVAVFGVFLLMQLVMLTSGKKRADEASESAASEPRAATLAGSLPARTQSLVQSAANLRERFSFRRSLRVPACAR